MQEPTPKSVPIVIEGSMWLAAHQSRHADHLEAEMAVDAPYRHITSIEIARPREQDLDEYVARVNALLAGAEVSVSAVVMDGNLRTTLAGISRLTRPDDGDAAFDEVARTRVGRLDDLFDELRDLEGRSDDLPTRPGSCALIIAVLAPFIERLGTMRCETSPVGGVIASIDTTTETISVHAMPQGHMTVTDSRAWNASARHDVASAQNALRTMLDLG